MSELQSNLLACTFLEVNGLKYRTVSIGLWLFRPWAFHATIVLLMSVLLLLFNWQYGLNGKYTLPLYFFIIYNLYLSFISVIDLLC